MEQEEKKVISILFTRYYNAFSNFIYWVGGRGYTHTSVALDAESEYYYSFNMRGFNREYPRKHKRRNEKSVCYLLEITAEDYEKISKIIEDMERTKDVWTYSRLGVFLCLLHIPHKIKGQYFCSQFIAELLQLTDSVNLQKKASLYLPNQLPYELARLNCLKDTIYNPI